MSIFYIRGNIINAAISIGISLCPENGRNINEILKSADIAMNKAKEKGRNNYVFYNNAMMIELQSKVEMEHALKRSILNCQHAKECSHWIASRFLSVVNSVVYANNSSLALP